MTDYERKVYDLRQEQVPIQHIAKRLGSTESSVGHACNRLKKKGLHLPHSRSLPPLKEEELRRLWTRKIPVSKIAELMGVSEASVRGSSRRLNLPNRRDARGVLALLTPEEQKWLHEQARDGVSINDIIAAIVRDAYAEEKE